jgi:hypothetical protein
LEVNSPRWARSHVLEDREYVNAAHGKSPNTIRLTVKGGIGHIRLEQE